MKNFTNYQLIEKKIILRVDLNVPLFKGLVTEKSRIKSIKKTIKKLHTNKNKIFILSHFGRPNGKRIKKYSLKFICPILKKELNLKKIFFLDNLKNEKIKNTIKKMNKGDVCLLENIRFYPGEEKNDLEFARQISKNFDAYINDAFSSSHRKHASIVGIPKFLPSYAGYNMIDEIKNINLFINTNKKPNLAIIGGSKISTKIDLVNNLIKKCNIIVIGGAMANTFLYALGYNIGNSFYEKKLSKTALNILEKSKKFNCKIILPSDIISADNLNDKNNIRQSDIGNIFSNQMILDVGEKTIKEISSYILKSKVVLWNGPLGAFEHFPFEKSSVKIANVIKKKSQTGLLSIAGGGDTLSVIKMAKAQNGFSYLSRAGGAFLEWLEGKSSPGVNALKNNKID